jgi:hypothetical protein
MEPHPTDLEQLIKLLLLILLPLVGGILAIWLSTKRLRERDELIDKGERVEGIIFDFLNDDGSIVTVSTGDTDFRARYPRIRFVTKSGEWITKQYQVTHTFLKQGDKVTVFYDPANPRNFHVQMGSVDVFLYGLIILAGIGAIGYGLYTLIVYLLQ